MKIYVIDPVAREVREQTVEKSYPDLQQIVGDWLTTAGCLPTGDYVFADDNGLAKNPQHFFKLSDAIQYQPVAGVGVVVGPDAPDPEDPEDTITLDVQIPIEALREVVTFLDRAGFERWALANARETASRVVSLNSDGTAEVLANRTVADMVNDMKKLEKRE